MSSCLNGPHLARSGRTGAGGIVCDLENHFQDKILFTIFVQPDVSPQPGRTRAPWYLTLTHRSRQSYLAGYTVSLEVPLISGFTRSSPCKIMRIIIIVSILAPRHTHDRFEHQLKVYTASGAALQQQEIDGRKHGTDIITQTRATRITRVASTTEADHDG